MNMLFIKHFFVVFIVSEIQRVFVFGHCPYSVTFPYIYHISYIYYYFTPLTFYFLFIRFFCYLTSVFRDSLLKNRIILIYNL